MRMLSMGVALAAVCAGACGAAAPSAAPGTPTTSAPPETPAAAAARTVKYSVVTVGRINGSGEITVAPDGVRKAHFSFNDRGRGPDLDTTVRLDAGGAPVEVHSAGKNYWGAPAKEDLAVENGQLVWHSTDEQGHAPAGGYFLPRQGPFDRLALLARALAAAPGKRLAILPAGEAWIEDESTLTVEVGGNPRQLRRVAIAGLGFSPGLTWLDEHGELFAEVSAWSSVIVAGAEALVPQLVAEDQKWMAARSARLAGELASAPPAAGLAIVHARVFDSERRRLESDRTVVVVGDKIVAVGGPKTKIPEGAQVVDAHGRTLIPGLWDMHVHMGDNDGILHLAAGVTSVRDMGNDAETLGARVARFDAGTEVGPHVLRAGLIDGPGEMAAPTGVLAGNEQEARAAVQKFAELGYQQIKIYSALSPELVPVIAKEAHARGLRVSGHVPQGMIAEQAVRAGFDEIQHGNMLILNFLLEPGQDLRGPARLTLVARGAAKLDLGSKAVQAFLALLVQRKTVLDPTLAILEGLFTTDPGEMNPVLAPFRGRLPAMIERNSREGGFAAGAGERPLYRASQAAMGKLVKLAWDKGIRVVAGTDTTAGLALSRELELYVAAGIPAADVLALATIGAARVMGKDKQAGSIAVGKQADLVLLDGDPTRDIAAVRRTDLVVCRGRVYDPGKLFAAVGMKPRSP